MHVRKSIRPDPIFSTRPRTPLSRPSRSTNGDGMHTFTIRPFGTKSLIGDEEEAGAAHRERHFSFFAVRPFGVKPKSEEFRIAETAEYQQSTYYFLLAQFGRWKAKDLQIDPATIGWDHQIHRLVQAAGQMARLGFLGDDQNCLCHLKPNLSPRNIIVDIDIDNSLIIPGILDLDSAVIVPKFVGCVPVMWIWAWNYGEDEKPMVRQRLQSNKRSNACLKKLLELSTRHSYEPEYRLARTLYTLAMGEIKRSSAGDIVDQFLEE